MLPYSAAIPCDLPAAAKIRARLAAAARRLDVADPSSLLERIVRSTFARPANDPLYRANQLQPGALPLEWSFSEADPDALRIELQPFDADLAPEERLSRAFTELLQVIQARCGPAATDRFRAAVARDPGDRHTPLSFGAFLGLALRPQRTPEFKLYVELQPQDDDLWRALLPAGVAPHMRSVAVSAGAVAERVYYLCRPGLRLLDLESLCAALGMAHQFPTLLLLILELSDGEFYLPPHSVLLGIRRNERCTELKVELISGLAMSPHGLSERVEGLLAPASVVPFRRWLEIVQPHALPLRVVSVRVTPTRPPQLSVYTAEQWGEP